MFSFTQSVTPAAKQHMEAQISYLNDMSRSLFRTVQQYSDLNIQLAQSIFEGAALTGQALLTSERPADVINLGWSHAQPAAEKLRAYQHHLSRIAANTHVDHRPAPSNSSKAARKVDRPPRPRRLVRAALPS